MDRTGIIVGLWLGVAATLAASPGNSYNPIPQRNVFALRPVEVKPVIEPPRPAPPKIIPTGITTILGRKLALLKIQWPAKPPEPAREESFILAVGERAQDVEVAAIDEQAGTIVVRLRGAPLTLSLDKDGPRR